MKHGLYLGKGTNEGWFLRIVGWRQFVILLAGLGACYALGAWEAS